MSSAAPPLRSELSPHAGESAAAASVCECHSQPKTADGRCAVRRRASQRAYDSSWKGRARHERYNATAAGLRRHIAYDVARGYDPFEQTARLAEREAYEASGSKLSLLDWLEAHHPLRALPPL